MASISEIRERFDNLIEELVNYLCNNEKLLERAEIQEISEIIEQLQKMRPKIYKVEDMINKKKKEMAKDIEGILWFMATYHP